MNTTTVQVLKILNSIDIETVPVEGTDKCHQFSTGVVGHDDIELNFLYLESDDNDFITFCSPGIYEYNDDEFPEVINAMNEMSIYNSFVKPVIIGGHGVWLYYEHKLFNQEVSTEMI